MQRAGTLASLVMIGATLGAAGAACGQSSLNLYAHLPKGAHTVTFEEHLVYDRARAAIADADLSTPRPAPADAAGRQIQYFVWRPASGGGSPMTFGDYVAADARRLTFAPLTPELAEAERRAYVRDLARPDQRPDFQSSVDIALRAPVRARADARPLRGRFPIVFIPDYFGADGPAILAEHLASNGYVVVAWESVGLIDDVIEVNARGVATLADDLRFVMNEMLDEPYVDPKRVGAIGMGYNASAIVSNAMASPVIDAWVNLDHGVLTSFDDNVLQRSPYFDPTRLRAPTLALYNPEPGLFEQQLEAYPFSERVSARFAQMTEIHFTSFGALSALVPDILGPSPGDTARSYAQAVDLIRTFLDAHVRDDDAARAALDAFVRAEAIGFVDRIAHRPALAAVPTLSDWRNLLAQDDGAARFAAAFAEARRLYPTPIHAETFNALHDALNNNGDDPDRSKRIALNEARVESYPDSARATFVLGGLYRAVGRDEEARALIERARILLPSDRDPAIHRSLRARILSD